jgi:hypothetical protein
VKTSTHITIAGIVFTASTAGFFVLLFLVPDRLNGSDPPLTTPERAICVLGVLLALPAVPLNLFVEWLQPPGFDLKWILGCNLGSGFFWSFVIASVRRFRRGRNTEPATPSNGGSAVHLGDLGVTEGRPR